jgi:hypothetical protein
VIENSIAVPAVRPRVPVHWRRMLPEPSRRRPESNVILHHHHLPPPPSQVLRGLIDRGVAALHRDGVRHLVADLAAWVMKSRAISFEGTIRPLLPAGMTERVLPSGDASSNGYGAGRRGSGMWSIVLEFPRED